MFRHKKHIKKPAAFAAKFLTCVGPFYEHRALQGRITHVSKNHN